jgi:hypothetical protein
MPVFEGVPGARCASILAAVVLTSALLVACSAAPAPDFFKLKEEAQPLIAALEEYKAVHGLYPDSLRAVGITPPSTCFGPWRYVVYGNRYEIAVGDYAFDGFVLYYNPNAGWELDQ